MGRRPAKPSAASERAALSQYGVNVLMDKIRGYGIDPSDPVFSRTLQQASAAIAQVAGQRGSNINKVIHEYEYRLFGGDPRDLVPIREYEAKQRKVARGYSGTGKIPSYTKLAPQQASILSYQDQIGAAQQTRIEAIRQRQQAEKAEIKFQKQQQAVNEYVDKLVNLQEDAYSFGMSGQHIISPSEVELTTTPPKKEEVGTSYLSDVVESEGEKFYFKLAAPEKASSFEKEFAAKGIKTYEQEKKPTWQQQHSEREQKKQEYFDSFQQSWKQYVVPTLPELSFKPSEEFSYGIPTDFQIPESNLMATEASPEDDPSSVYIKDTQVKNGKTIYFKVKDPKKLTPEQTRYALEGGQQYIEKQQSLFSETQKGINELLMKNITEESSKISELIGGDQISLNIPESGLTLTRTPPPEDEGGSGRPKYLPHTADIGGEKFYFKIEHPEKLSDISLGYLTGGVEGAADVVKQQREKAAIAKLMKEQERAVVQEQLFAPGIRPKINPAIRNIRLRQQVLKQQNVYQSYPRKTSRRS